LRSPPVVHRADALAERASLAAISRFAAQTRRISTTRRAGSGRLAQAGMKSTSIAAGDSAQVTA